MINKLLIFFIYFVANFIVLPQYIYAETIITNTTRPIVPRVAGEGSIGRFDKPWSSGVFSNSISLNGIVIEDFKNYEQTMFCIETNIVPGQTIDIPGTIVAIYDNTPVEKTIPFYFNSTNVTLVSQENWQRSAKHLTVANTGDLSGTIDGWFDPHAVSNSVWMFLGNGKKIWLTGVINGSSVSWADTFENKLDAGTYDIVHVTPAIIDEKYGFCYGIPNGTNFSWSNIGSENSLCYDGITSINGTNIWVTVSTDSGILWCGIYKSKNGGISWEKLVGVPPNNYSDIETRDENTFWCTVYGKYPMKSVDGGNTWTILTNATARNWWRISSYDNTNVYATADNSYIYKSEDGGKTWNTLTQSGSRRWFGLKALSNNVVFAAAYDNYVYKSINGGVTWDRISNIAGKWISLETLDGSTIYCGVEYNNDRLWKSTDGGVSWMKADYAVNANPRGLLLLEDGTIIGATWNNYIYKTVPDVRTRSFYTASPTNVPCHTSIFRFSNNGLENAEIINEFIENAEIQNTYKAVSLNENEWYIWGKYIEKIEIDPMSSNQFFSSSFGFFPIAASNGLWRICGIDGTLERFEAESIGAAKNGSALYAAVSGGVIWKSVDGGTTWNPLNNAGSRYWWGVATADGTTVYAAVYNGGLIWKSVDGGTTWNPLNNAGSRNWVGVATADGTTVYAAVYGGVIWKSVENIESEAEQQYFTITTEIKTNDLYRLRDFSTTEYGNSRSYWSFETAENEFSIFGYPNSSWHVIAKKQNDDWYIRTTNSNNELQMTNIGSSYSKPEVISIALETNSLNRMSVLDYSPVYGYDVISNKMSVACTFTRDPSFFNDAPILNSVTIDYDKISEIRENSIEYDIILNNGNSKITRTGELPAGNVKVYYIKNKE